MLYSLPHQLFNTHNRIKKGPLNAIHPVAISQDEVSCRRSGIVSVLIATALCVCSVYPVVHAEDFGDIVIEHGNICLNSGEIRNYDSLSITNKLTGDIYENNYEENGQYETPVYRGTGAQVWNKSQLSIKDDLTINVVPEPWYGNKFEERRVGMFIQTGSQVTVGGKTTILVDNYISESVNDDDDYLGMDKDYGLNSQRGIDVSGEGTVLNFNGGLDITMLDGNRSMGIYIWGDDAAVNVQGDTSIVVKNAEYYTYGIGNQYSDQKYDHRYTGTDGKFHFNGNLSITTVGGNNSIGINLKDSTYNSLDEPSFNVEGHTYISASGAKYYEHRTDLQAFPFKVSNYGIFMRNIASASFNTAEIVTTAEGEGVESIGTYAYSSTNIVFRGDVAYRTTAESEDSEISSVARRWSSIIFEKGLTADGHVALNASGDSSITVNRSKDSQAIVRLDGNIVTGSTTADVIFDEATYEDASDPYIDRNGTDYIRVNLLNNQSYFTGVNVMANEFGTINLNFADGARWNMTGSSPVTDLTMNNASVVDMTYERGDNGFRTLSAETLGGDGGIFKMDADIQADLADQVHILKEATGNHALAVASTGEEPNREYMETFLVRQESGDAAFTLQGGAIDAGVYQYELASRPEEATGATEWYLERKNKPVDPNHPGDGELTPTAEAVLGLSGMATTYAMWMGQLSNLRERLGEIRYGASNDGVWMRAFAAKNSLTGLGGINLDQDVYGVALGYDRLYQSSPRDSWLFGLRGQYTEGDQDVRNRFRASGESEAYGIAAYGTWSNKKGWYTDTVLSWDWYDQDLNTAMSDGRPVSGSYNSYAAGISQEVGKMFDLGDNMFVEPQAQLSYYWMKGEDYTTSNGMNVTQDDAHSLTARVGAVFGKRWVLDNDRYVQPYVMAGVNYEFLGDQEANVNGHHFDGDLQGCRIYYGVGVDYQISKDVRVYGQFEREEGHYVSTPWSASVGFRISF